MIHRAVDGLLIHVGSAAPAAAEQRLEAAQATYGRRRSRTNLYRDSCVPQGRGLPVLSSWNEDQTTAHEDWPSPLAHDEQSHAPAPETRTAPYVGMTVTL